MLLSPQRIPTHTHIQATIALEPTMNAILSMVSLLHPENYGGIDNWAEATTRDMGADLHEQHRFLIGAAGLDGLTNLVSMTGASDDFEAFLDRFSELDPTKIRDTLFYWLFNSPHVQVNLENAYRPIDTIEPFLNDFDRFEARISSMMTKKVEEGRLERVFQLYQDPVALKSSILDHIQLMWERYIKPEWEQIRPRLQASVDAFTDIPLHDLTMLEAIEKVTGRDMSFAFQMDELLKFGKVRFIPHQHSGPYIIWFGNHDELRISFPPRIPEASPKNTISIDFTALTNRFKALGDEVRLQILMMIREREEVSTQEVIEAFELDKSAASRHLRQLIATSLLIQRREDGAKKVYRLNPEAMTEITRLLQRLSL